jgi:TolB-like protein
MGSTTTFGPFVLDRERKQLTRHGDPVAVGHRGYLLLEALLDAQGEPVSKDALMERVWPASAVEEGNLTVLVSTVRRHLGDEAAGIVTVPRVGYRLLIQAKDAGRRAADRTGPPLIGVLPFANHSDNPEDGYFADGMVDDIITALSRFKNFGVLARGSTFALRQRGADVSRIGAELGVRYALEGSVRRLGDRLRVTARLLDTMTGAALWAELYDGALADVFSFQDQLTKSVVGVIEPTIRKAEIERARRKPAANVDAYDLYLRALPLVYAPGSEQHAEAIRLLGEASELDPTFALPRAYAALIYEIRLSMRVPPLGNHDAETSLELARSALDLGGDDPLVRSICAYVLFRIGNDVSALEALRTAVRENPNNAAILTHAADGVGMYGCLEESIDYHSRAYALSPGSHEAYQNLFGIGASHFLLGHYETAIEWSMKSLATFNDLIYTHVCLTCCYAALDRMDEAHASARRVLEINPALSIKLIQDGAAGKDDAFAVGIIPWLRKVGFPER